MQAIKRGIHVTSRLPISSLLSVSATSSGSSLFLFSSKSSFSYITKRLKLNVPKVVVKRPSIPNLRPTDQKIDKNSLNAIEEITDRIDTSLTKEQSAHVEKLKKIMKGASGKRSIYRDVPRPNEVEGYEGFLPNIPPNAEQVDPFYLCFYPNLIRFCLRLCSSLTGR
jgi:hypothetical protein